MNKIKTLVKKIFSKRGLASVAAAAKVCTAVLCGAVLATGAYAVHQNVVLPSTQEKAQAIGTYESTVGSGAPTEPVTPTVSTYQLTITFQNDIDRRAGKIVQHYESSGNMPLIINPSFEEHIGSTDDYIIGDIPGSEHSPTTSSYNFEVEEGLVEIGYFMNGYYIAGTITCSGGVSLVSGSEGQYLLSVSGDGEIVFNGFDWRD